jgi:hypothetical protein
MSLSNNGKDPRPPQTRTQKIVMYAIFGVAGVLLVIAVVVFIVSGAPLF